LQPKVWAPIAVMLPRASNAKSPLFHTLISPLPTGRRISID